MVQQTLKLFDRVVLIDGKNFCFKNHWTRRMLSSKGRPTGLLYGALAGILSLGKRFPNTPIVFVWDGEGATWRHKLAPNMYKANRGKLPPSDEIKNMYKQFPLLQSWLAKIGMRQFVIPNLECDDLIGILASTICKLDLFKEVVIASSDKDFYQLVSQRVQVLRKFDSGETAFVTEKYVRSRYGVGLKDWVTFRSITGDASDNIPKVKRGLGPVGASKLIQEGLCAAVPTFDCLSKAERAKFKDFKDLWPALHLNFILSTIVQSRDNVHLPTAVKSDLSRIVNHLDRLHFFKLSSKHTDEVFQWFTGQLVDYEMEALMTRRLELWNLP